MPKLLQLIPEYHHRVWGGQRLRPARPLSPIRPDGAQGDGRPGTPSGVPGIMGAQALDGREVRAGRPADKPIGEAWIVYEQCRIASGPLAGRTLADVAAEGGAALLGERALHRTGTRFPLLIKLLDCADWLSIQVHPNDAQARQLEGPSHFGKTEAWHILEAEADARLIAGVKPGVTREALAEAIRNGTILDWAQSHPVQAGDTLFIPAGTLHALGPGLLLYEVQQTSDITYRVFDWNRPASAGRALHIEQSLAVTDPTAHGDLKHLPDLGLNDRRQLVACEYFSLELLVAQTESMALDTRGETFHALTVVEGGAEVECGDERLRLKRFETALVSASGEAYRLHPHDSFRILKASVI